MLRTQCLCCSCDLGYNVAYMLCGTKVIFPMVSIHRGVVGGSCIMLLSSLKGQTTLNNENVNNKKFRNIYYGQRYYTKVL